MGKQTNSLPKNRILHLTDAEVKNPILVAHDFFSASWLPKHLKMLKQWRNAVAFESCTNKLSASSLLFDYELTIKLVEAAWLLKNKNVGKVQLDIRQEKNIAKCCLKIERKKLRDYPTHLSFRELTRPCAVLRKMFRAYNLVDYREILNIWLYDALGERFMEESLTKSEVIVIYEQLRKLYEAMWLISERNRRAEFST